MSKCFDHKTTFPDTHNQIPPDSHIYTLEAIFELGSAPEEQLEKLNMLGFTAYGYSRTFYFGDCIFIYANIHIYIYIYIPPALPASESDTTLDTDVLTPTLPCMHVHNATLSLLATLPHDSDGAVGRTPGIAHNRCLRVCR